MPIDMVRDRLRAEINVEMFLLLFPKGKCLTINVSVSSTPIKVDFNFLGGIHFIENLPSLLINSCGEFMIRISNNKGSFNHHVPAV